MSIADMHTLTGAYALDALDDVERRQFTEHLADCPACANEVNELRATAAKLAVAVAVRPPDSLRRTVMAQVAATRQDPPFSRPGTVRPRRRVSPGQPSWAIRTAATVAGLAAAVAMVLGVVTVRAVQQRDEAQDRISQLQAQYGVLAQLESAGDAHRGTAQAINGATAFVLASRSLDEAVLIVSDLPKAPPGHTYQAWLISQGRPRSIGLLPTRASTPRSVSTLTFGGLEHPGKVGVTVEPSGGSAQPTTAPVVLFDLPA